MDDAAHCAPEFLTAVTFPYRLWKAELDHLWNHFKSHLLEMEHHERLSREVVDALFLETSKVRLDGALSTWGGLDQMAFKVSSNSNNFMILPFYERTCCTLGLPTCQPAPNTNQVDASFCLCKLALQLNGKSAWWMEIFVLFMQPVELQINFISSGQKIWRTL